MAGMIINVPFELDLKSLAEQARLKLNTDDAREFEALVDAVRGVARPKALYKEFFIQVKGKNTVTIDNVTFTSRILLKNLDKTERVFPYVATCGNEVDLLEISPDDYLKRFWLDIIKTALLGFSVAHLRKLLADQYKLGKVACMNPGDADAGVWPIEQQRELFALFGDVEKLIGVRLTDSFLMIPNKSLSGIYFPSEVDFESCQICRRKKCHRRKIPFDGKLWKSLNHDTVLKSHLPEGKHVLV